MLEVIAWTLYYFVFGFMIFGATMLIVDTLIQWKREREIHKTWHKETF